MSMINSRISYTKIMFKMGFTEFAKKLVFKFGRDSCFSMMFRKILALEKFKIGIISLAMNNFCLRKLVLA